MQVYIGNRTETLLDSLLYVLEHQPALDGVVHPLQHRHIVVQNRGMRHWLSMQMATAHGIAMNVQFPMITEIIWKILQQIEPQTEHDNSYRREVMAWRIFDLLPQLQKQPELASVSRFLTLDKSGLKRFQLAGELADLLEQYMVFRPNMIAKWQHGEIDHWQGIIWQALQIEGKPNLADKLRSAIHKLHRGDFTAPHFSQPLYIFGLTHMAPIWLEFLQALSKHRPVHLFYLSPCNEYWGDLITDKSQARQRAQWVRDDKSPGEVFSQAGHPLLAAWGWMGQEFVNKLYQEPINDVDLFDRDLPTPDSVLTQLQQDIMNLTDHRDAPLALSPDASLSIHSAHSRMREVQALHDWLLAQFADDQSLTPKDVLVMCPAIEDYAPFVESVFCSRYQTTPNAVQLPCSIADRTLLHSDPLINSYKQLLFLPDSRFAVTEIIEQLSVPAIQRRFRFTVEEIERLQHWLAQVAVHWGLNSQHKATLQLPVNNHYTWQQGLTRLIYGMTLEDQEQYYQGYLTCPLVEGSHAETLGKLLDFLEQLRRSSRELQQAKPMPQWQSELKNWTDRLYQTDNDDIRSVFAIHKAIDELAQHYHEAGVTAPVSLSVIRDSLMSAFNQPIEGQSFLTGQVTFCSMIPMRSIPFKIIAILGLNAGDFPRIKPAKNFDLMANNKRQAGDRSRKLEDRYLFLEALLSARRNLYLSYCGRSIKDNSVQQPSLVLTELLANLEEAYQLERTQLITQHPLQPFSESLFQAPQPRSFNQRWLRILQTPPLNAPLALTAQPLPDVLHLNELIRALDNPAQYFAEQRLKIRFEAQNQPLVADEPFDANGLHKYQYQRDYIDLSLTGESCALDLLNQKTLDRGHFGHTPRTLPMVEQLQHGAQAFMQQLAQVSPLPLAQLQHKTHHALPITVDGHRIQLVADVCYDPTQARLDLIHFAPVTFRAKYALSLWLHHVFMQALHDKPCTSTAVYKAEKNKLKVLNTQTRFSQSEATAQLQQLLQFYQRSLQGPILAPLKLLLMPLLSNKPLTQADIQAYWQGDEYDAAHSQGCPYHRLFWPTPPSLQDEAWQLGCAFYEALQIQLNTEARA